MIFDRFGPKLSHHLHHVGDGDHRPTSEYHVWNS